MGGGDTKSNIGILHTDQQTREYGQSVYALPWQAYARAFAKFRARKLVSTENLIRR